ncbi:MAG: hypothetical protein GX046_10400 [Tissierellia bacterium]|nr:hypothetical protein [Tissierellia bacterium]
MGEVFELNVNQQFDFFTENIDAGSKLDVVEMDFVSAKTLTWKELFKGYDKLYCITYSSGIGFICELLKLFDYAEVIFGFEGVMSYKLQEIMAYQQKTIERLQTESSKAKIDLTSRMDNNELRMYVARQRLSHEKIYLLEAGDGRKRVITGSANMSFSAFTGRQRENISYIDGDKAFDWYFNSFKELKELSSDDITTSALSISEDSSMDELPIGETIKIRKALIIEPDLSVKDEVEFALNVKNLAKKLTSYMPKVDKKGNTSLTPETMIQTRRRIVDANIQEKELRSEYPHLVIDIENQKVKLNDKEVKLTPTNDEIKNDVNLFIEYMEGYQKFHGDVGELQRKYYSFAVWFFTTPFMATMRNIAVKYNQNLLPYPVFGLIYGQSKAGKTTFLETLIKMMIGQKLKISAPEFTRSSIDGLRRSVMGAPIIVDDLTQSRFNQHAIETIKNDDFGVLENNINYPAVVISANEDVKAVAAEIVRRTIICHVQAGLKNTDILKTRIVRRVQNNIGTAFYREYLNRMMEIMPELIEELKDEEFDGAVDLLEVSSVIIYEILQEHYDKELPDYIRVLSLDDYFNEKVTGSQAIETIQRAWQVNRKAFEVNKKYSQLRYNAGQTWEADRILKELPEDINAQKSREYIIMDLDKASDFFDIKFKKESGLLGLLKDKFT